MAKEEIMSPQEIETKVKEIICKELEVSPEKVRPETSFTDDLKAKKNLASPSQKKTPSK
jgi:hypothetical protein